MSDVAERVIEFGPAPLEQIPWVDLQVLTQTRKTMPGDGLEELMRAIEALDEANRPRFQLLHPLTVNRISDDDVASTYLDDLNLCHKTEHSLADISRGTSDAYEIVVSGHRRRMATGRLISQYGADPVLSTVASSVYHNLSFTEALGIQINENTGQPLPVHEMARAIHATWNYGQATGRYNSITDCIRDLPFGRAKVLDALKFCDLPDFLQDWVEDGRIKYGTAVALQPLLKGLEERYGDQPEDMRDVIVRERMMTEGIKIITNRWGRDLVTSRVRDLLAALHGPDELQLFQTDELTIARQARQQAFRDLLFTGIGLVRQFVAIGQGRLLEDIHPEQREAMLVEVAELYERLGGVAIHPTSSQELLHLAL